MSERDQDERTDNEKYTGPERRTLKQRRVKPDQRKGIRFDPDGGDRRSGIARRKDDVGIHEWEDE